MVEITMSYVIKSGDMYMKVNCAWAWEQSSAYKFETGEKAQAACGEGGRVVRLVSKAKYVVKLTVPLRYFRQDWVDYVVIADKMPRDLARAVAKFWGGKVVKVK